MDINEKQEVSRLAMSHEMTVDTALGIHKIVTDIAYDLGKADMKVIFDIVCATLWLQTIGLKNGE